METECFFMETWVFIAKGIVTLRIRIFLYTRSARQCIAWSSVPFVATVSRTMSCHVMSVYI